MKISRYVNGIPGSATLAISAKAGRMKAEGIDVISFSAGEPDFITPTPVLDAASKAMYAGATKYTAVGGSPALKAAIRRYVERRVGATFSDKEIIASCGAKHSLYNAFLTLLDPGDEVIIPAPYWVSYPTQVEMAGGKPVFVDGLASNDFVPTVEALEAAVTDRTTAIVTLSLHDALLISGPPPSSSTIRRTPRARSGMQTRSVPSPSGSAVTRTSSSSRTRSTTSSCTTAARRRSC